MWGGPEDSLGRALNGDCILYSDQENDTLGSVFSIDNLSIRRGWCTESASDPGDVVSQPVPEAGK